MTAPTLLCPTFLSPVNWDFKICPEISTEDCWRVDDDGDPGGIHRRAAQVIRVLLFFPFLNSICAQS
jgi:hypothetical protein